MRKYGFRDWDSVLAAIGHGGLKEGQVLNKLIETYEKQHKKEITDEQVLEAASGEKVLPVERARAASSCAVSTMWQFASPNAAIRSRAMRSWVLSQEDAA